MEGEIYKKQTKGIIFMMIACIFFAASNNVIKHLSVSVSPTGMVFYKNFISFLILLPFVFLMKGSIFNLSHINKYNIIRSLIDVLSIVLWFKAVGSSPISQAVAVTFLTPFFISLIAIFTLKEHVDFTQWILMLIGFIGALIVIQPQFDFNSKILYAVGASFLWAISAVLFKKLTFIQNSFIIIFVLKGLKSIISFPLFIYDFQLLNAEQILFLIFLGILANSAVYFVALAYKYSNISVVVPFDFLRLVLTSLIAFLIFGEAVRSSTVYGSVVILFAASMLAKRVRIKENRMKKQYGG